VVHNYVTIDPRTIFITSRRFVKRFSFFFYQLWSSVLLATDGSDMESIVT